MSRDGTLGRFRALGAGGARRTFDTLEDAREFSDREADLTREERERLKPDTVIDRELIEGVLLYLERHDQLAAATVNGYRKTARYALYPLGRPGPRDRPASAPLDDTDVDDQAAGGVVLAPHGS